MDLSQIELLLVVAAFVAGIVDAIAGGGGLIVIPLMLISGMPPLQVLGTGKLQAMGSSLAATVSYTHKKLVRPRTQILAAVLCAVAAFIGANAVSTLPSEWLGKILPVVLIAVALYFGLKRGLSDDDRHARLSAERYGKRVAPFIAFYDGFFGPGAGTFYMLGFVTLSGLGLTRATAHTKLLNFSSNFGAFLAFAWIGVINWRLGLLMGAAQILGGTIGAHFGSRKGAKIIKPLLVIVTLAMALRLLIS